MRVQLDPMFNEEEILNQIILENYSNVIQEEKETIRKHNLEKGKKLDAIIEAAIKAKELVKY